MREKVKEYILKNWHKTIKVNTKDKGDLIGLPKPYTIPCVSNMFQEMYYWDTYFTNVGLICSGNVEQADKTVAKLPLIECEFGVASCEDNGNLHNLQWDHPHGWACLHYIIIQALLKYGYKDEALRIAEKYVNTVAKNFETTNNLWEKYNVVTGTVSVTSEYDTPPMMGWSAGIYLFCLELIELK